MLKKPLIVLFSLTLICLLAPKPTFASGIGVSGGGTKYVGDSATVTITASGAAFNGFSGTISTSGSIRVTNVSSGDALWVHKPSASGTFDGALTANTTSFRIATLTVQGTAVGTGRVTVSGVTLANSNGAIVGSDGGSATFTFQRKPTPPGGVSVTSSTHPDEETAYEATAVTLSWEKASGVTGFAYLLDDVADTVPPSTVTSADTTVTYNDQQIGTHYFHIKALNADGWGGATHFKIQIKEPDPKVNDTLSKPTILEIKKISPFTDDPVAGTLSGISIKGTTLPNYMANINLTPRPTPAEGKTFSVQADGNGNFEYLIDFPIAAGFYKLTVQGQDNKVLTAESDPTYFEISLAKGGTINILSSTDANEPIIVIPVKKWYQKINYLFVSIGLLLLLLISAAFNFLLWHKGRKGLEKIAHNIKINNEVRKTPSNPLN